MVLVILAPADDLFDDCPTLFQTLQVVTIDKSGANTAALTTLNTNKPEEERMVIRQSKYLSNLVEQDTAISNDE